LNAGAEVERLGVLILQTTESPDEAMVEEPLLKLRLIQKLTLILVVAFLAGQAIFCSVGQP